jgi:Virulence-associated protein E-like domain
MIHMPGFENRVRRQEAMPQGKPAHRKANGHAKNGAQHLEWLHPHEIAARMSQRWTKKGPNGAMAQCPCHADNNPSLSIDLKGKGKLVFRCFADCEQEAILSAVMALGVAVFPPGDGCPRMRSSGNIASLLQRGWKMTPYSYVDADGVEVYQNVRLELFRRDGTRIGKTFRQRQPNMTGDWTENLTGITQIPYFLPQLLASTQRDVHMVEGEKAADALARLGLVVTSVATPQIIVDHAPVFRDRVVYVHEDRDTPGRKKALARVAALANITNQVRLVRYPQMPEHSGPDDWLAEHGNDLEAFRTHCANATEKSFTAEGVTKELEEDFARTARGAIAKSEGNIRRSLAMAGVKLSYDQFARQRIIVGLQGYGPDLTDAAIDAMWIRFEREHRVRFSREHLNAVIRVEAHANSYHPVRDYLSAVTWDGKPRIDTWLSVYAGAEDTGINRQFGRLTLIAAVRRARHPGTKFDAMLVLEGPEGRNKSTLFETLASSDWFSDDAPLNADARETIERLRGKWSEAYRCRALESVHVPQQGHGNPEIRA